ncbi:hypothetical protein [Xanthobacter versatilis]|uniref:hypothetical protein n=1 Tax=Xanthobacter autotrophicus (strain ATCC BAA-1158 / Py2) TaxID=78245 RepID=UPI00372D41FE
MARLGDGAAFTNHGRDLNRAELDRLSRALAAWLSGELGLAPGDRVAVTMPTLLRYRQSCPARRVWESRPGVRIALPTERRAAMHPPVATNGVRLSQVE